MKNTNFSSTDEILNFAINNEQEAHDFYISMAEKMKDNVIKDSFLEFAKEELAHKRLLEKIKTDGLHEVNDEKVTNLMIGDFLVKSDKNTNEMTYQDALILAMKREKAAYKLYTYLAEKTDNEKMKKTFFTLAQEEAKHKLKFETEYDDLVYREN